MGNFISARWYTLHLGWIFRRGRVSRPVMPFMLGDFVCLLSRFEVNAMLKWIIDTFYDIVDYGLFSVFDKKNSYRSPQSVSEASEEDVQQNNDGEQPAKNFFVRHIIDFIGIALTVLVFISEKFAESVSIFLLVGYVLWLMSRFVIIPIILAMNIAAYIMIGRDNEAGVIPAFFGGIIGAELAVHIENPEYAGRVFIKVFFKIFIWICVVALLSVLYT